MAPPPSSAGPRGITKKTDRRGRKATGPQDDCYDCKRDQIKCDRQRPYCSQCLSRGFTKCGGYAKTDFQWGQGVASRGRLRGRSIPVKELEEQICESIVPKKESKATSRSPSIVTIDHSQHFPQVDGGDQSYRLASFSGLGYQLPSPPGTLTQVYEQWAPKHRNHPRLHSIAELSPHELEPAKLPDWSPHTLPDSRRSSQPDRTNHYDDADHLSPYYSRAPGTVKLINGERGELHAYHSHAEFQDAAGFSPSSAACTTSEQSVYGYHSTPLSPLTSFSPATTISIAITPDDDHEVRSPCQSVMNIYESRFATPFYQVDVKLRPMMEFYERNVCPWIVAFDGPDNPYRKHVLVHAMRSQALQYAIAALAENNHFKRTRGFVEDIEASSADRSQLQAQGQSDRCQLLKRQACNLLNKQLEAPDAAEDDSVLATILVLCLLSVCDTGVSRMTSQMEGVQKLLLRRSPSSRQSDYFQWVQMFFIWFDVMTSAVNQRETRITGHGLDWHDLRTDIGSMEELSGCDGRLVKVIAKLGRLDCLATAKPVRTMETDMATMSNPQPMMASPDAQIPTTTLAQASVPYTLQLQVDDTLGFTPPFMPDFDVDHWSFPDLDPPLYGNITTPKFPDNRIEFWQEWHAARTALETWTPRQLHPSSSSITESPTQLASRDAMLHINQSFRSAGLLFTERLADPLAPSSAPRFQRHLRAGMQHIHAIPIASCVTKFLLWPLFILGSECAAEPHRELIRRRCHAIHRESGFENNLAVLEMLERIWGEISPGPFGAEPGTPTTTTTTPPRPTVEEEMRGRRRDWEESSRRTGGGYGDALRWRKVMRERRGREGECIVI